ncbi:MAG TPA: hypothetical protein VGB57_06595 [Allosphingosinicella sp.]|jgi:hypothetical protein
MSKASNKPVGRSRVLGSKAFAAISAVEGLKLSRDSSARLDTLRSSSLGGDERRSAVGEAYRDLRTSK